MRKIYSDYVIFSVILGLSTVSLSFSLTSCHHDSLEDKAEKMAVDYTERYCPTPEHSFQITDSVTFDRDSHTFGYHYTLTGKADNRDIIEKSVKDIKTVLLSQLRQNTDVKIFKDAGYSFHYVYRSKKTGKKLFEETITEKEYQ